MLVVLAAHRLSSSNVACQPDSTHFALLCLAANLLRSIPVVALGLIHWTRKVVLEPDFFSEYTSKRIPPHFGIIDQIVQDHPALNAHVLELLQTIFEFPYNIDVQLLVELKRQVLDRIIFQLLHGYAVPVMDYISNLLVFSKIDLSLAVHFVAKVSDSIGGPFSAAVGRCSPSARPPFACVLTLLTLLARWLAGSLAGFGLVASSLVPVPAASPWHVRRWQPRSVGDRASHTTMARGAWRDCQQSKPCSAFWARTASPPGSSGNQTPDGPCKVFSGTRQAPRIWAPMRDSSLPPSPPQSNDHSICTGKKCDRCTLVAGGRGVWLWR